MRFILHSHLSLNSITMGNAEMKKAGRLVKECEIKNYYQGMDKLLLPNVVELLQ